MNANVLVIALPKRSKHWSSLIFRLVSGQASTLHPQATLAINAGRASE